MVWLVQILRKITRSFGDGRYLVSKSEGGTALLVKYNLLITEGTMSDKSSNMLTSVAV
jgi:hypothetical protein